MKEWKLNHLGDRPYIADRPKQNGRAMALPLSEGFGSENFSVAPGLQIKNKSSLLLEFVHSGQQGVGTAKD